VPVRFRSVLAGALEPVSSTSMGSPDVVIVDYGMGNVGSLQNMFAKLGARAELSREATTIASAERVLLPGVGAFDEAMATLRRLDLVTPLVDRAAAGRRLLGICLGMQLLLDGSDEGVLPGLGLVPGHCARLDREEASDGPRLKVPHMGWNEVSTVRAEQPLPSLADEGRYYFVHSFHAVPDDPDHVLGTTVYGVTFASAVHAGSVTGLQFHPEKSHRHGMRLLADFVAG
jgi:imidazole glycerol-phosphate synthase subunit HisH